jgi:hypothetical protein
MCREGKDMGMLGASIRPDVCGLPYGCASGAGFSHGYSGSEISFSNEIKTVNGVKIFKTTDNHQHYIVKSSDIERPKTQVILKMSGTKVLSIRLTVPNYKREIKDGINYLVYRGSNETACGLSGELAK